MRLIFMRRLIYVMVLLVAPFIIVAQKKSTPKYAGLLWQITGKGLSKPSYLFGTMHVSSKMAFNLSDSFYLGIKNADVVALELDPQLWQDQMYRFKKMQSNLRAFSQGAPNGFLNEKSFQIENYEDKLKQALSDEPTVINGLLYRSIQPSADFEEDTYLDLYIYQTGKKFGKQTTGVENYFETEKLMLEAAQDMLKDKQKRTVDFGNDFSDIGKKLEDAYRRGDLDLLDSLEKLMQPSDAYLEKFLYRRNEIQAKAIDSILKNQSLFVGVGAAHLPGKRGVIELLRSKGYKLRPVAMLGRDEKQRDLIDKAKVPVRFIAFTSDEGNFTVKLPGKLYKRSDSRSNESWQYADMSNGAYYMVEKVRTFGSLTGLGTEATLKKIDSLLYENIPGKILKKSIINRNGYTGYDITNKTRRGDMQRYHILVTPFEIFIFKMSGTGNYVDGEEAAQFFASIEIKKNGLGKEGDFQPRQGGFSIKMPLPVYENKNATSFDGNPRWEYQSIDTSNGDAYLIMKKSILNFRFLEEDTFCLKLMEESFLLSDCIDKTISDKWSIQNGRQVLQADYRLKDGSMLKARYFRAGPHYYLLAARSKLDKPFVGFFDSFSFVPFRYKNYENYIDTFINLRVNTPVVPDVDANLRSVFEKTSSEEFLSTVSDYNSYWLQNKTALFQDDSTGEAVFVSVESYPKYYYPKDSASFWKDEMDEGRISNDMVIRSKQPFHFDDTSYGYKYIFSDTGSSVFITNWAFVKNNRFCQVMSLTDSLYESEFAKRFYESVRLIDNKQNESLFKEKLDIFFKDFYSKDSAINKRAKNSIPNIYFGPAAVPRLMTTIQSLPFNEIDYFDTKTKLINELGFIRNEKSIQTLVSGLKNVYEKTADTSTFQNAVIKALARNKTKESYQLLKTLIVVDPPIFDNPSDYNYLFQNIGDSLALAQSLFPELMQLATIDDYKENVQSLLTILVDSGYMKAKDYSDYFSRIYIEAKIQLKKQLAHDEASLQKKKDGDNDAYNEQNWKKDNNKSLLDYAVLLMPFYDKNPNVPKFFEKLIQSKDPSIKLNTAILLLRNHQACPDTLLLFLSKSDLYRFPLYKGLESVQLKSKFPKKYLNQMDLAKSALASSGTGAMLYDMEYVDKRLVNSRQDSGWVYFFKYRTNKDDESWQMGISGLQPIDTSHVSSNDGFILLTNKRLVPNKPVADQFNDQLKRLLFSKHKSAVSFYLDTDYFIGRSDDDN